MKSRKLDIQVFAPVAVLVVVSALIYLPNLLRATVFIDDWYYILDRFIGGPGVFQAMFSIDRPARGPFFELYYLLFGISPFPYHLASFAWRLLSGLSAYWLFRLLWPGQPQRRIAMWMALLFMVFPGYLRWMEGMEDQPMIASVCLQALSYALTLKAITSTHTASRVLVWLASILTGWAYLALVDYAIGMEVFRFLCVFVVVSRSGSFDSLWQRLYRPVRTAAPALLVPFGFLFWRLFIFHNTRNQTDVGRQLGVLLSSPLSTASLWFVHALQSAADVLLFSWITPILQGYFDLRLKEMLIGGLVALLVVAAAYLANALLARGSDAAADDPSASGWEKQALWVGLLGVVVGVLPAIVANRHVDFTSYSHYALPASLAGAVFVMGLLASFRSRTFTLCAALVLVGCASVAHFVYSSGIVDSENIVSGFWQQVSWRAPSLRSGTTLFVNYPGFQYFENPDAVTGPANFMYFPEHTGQIPVTYAITALSQSSTATSDVLVGKDLPTGYRTHTGSLDFQHFLVLSQPSASSCVHALNASSPLYSKDDPDQIRVMGQRSNTAAILAVPRPYRLEAPILGPEPGHNWCYYFEKADLALQLGNWQQVAALGKQAASAGLHPEDWVEWMPFLQAYAHLGDEPLFTATAHGLNADPFARLQACDMLQRMESAGGAFSAPIRSQMDNLLCKGE